MSFRTAVLRALRNKFIAGLIILIPIVITAKALWMLFSYVDEHARPLTKALAGRELPGSGFAVTVLVVFLTGLLFSWGPLARFLEGLVEVAEAVPFVGSVYGTLRKVLSGFGSPESRQAFQRFVLVRRGGVLTPGFLTSTFTLATKEIPAATYHTVFVPTNHLYLGDILVLASDEVILTDVRVEDGIGMILSAGSSVPQRIQERERAADDPTAASAAPPGARS